MNYKLSEISEIQYGPFAKTSPNGKVKYLLASHFNEYNELKNINDCNIELDELERFLLTEQDVILAAKGSRIFSWAYTNEFGQVIPSSLFYIIKINPKIILAPYLSIVLNSESFSHKLKLIGSGATVISIPKKELMELSIPVPSLLEQKKVIRINQLFNKNINLYSELIIKNLELKQEILNKLIKQTI